jgi:hypothetical protein
MPAKTIRSPSAEVEAMSGAWGLVDALMGGTVAMRAAGKKYLPQWPAEEYGVYEDRLATATLFPAYSRTVSVLVGKPFSKPVTFDDDMPPRIMEWTEDIDLQGRNMHVFAAEVCHSVLAYGLSGILVDAPRGNGARSVADERAAGIRPYMLHIKPHCILGWRAEKGVLTQLRLLEHVEIEDGLYHTKCIEQVRLLEIGTWSTWRQADGAKGQEDRWELFEAGTRSLQPIPFVPVYGFRTGFMTASPPMIELGHANVHHWQSASDQQTILHVARVPMIFCKGLGDMEFNIGAGSLIKSQSPDADVKFVEHSGKAIEAGRISLLDLEDRMRQIGAELLVIKPGNITEVATVNDNEMGMCDLQRIMQSAEDSLDKALDFMAQWVGEADGGHVSIYRDFGAATLAEASANLLFSMNSVGKLSNVTMLEELKRRGILSPDVEVEEEIVAAKADAPPVEVAETVSART